MTKKLNSFEVDIFWLFIYLYRNIKIIFIWAFFGGVAGLVLNQYKLTQLQTSYINLEIKPYNNLLVEKLYNLLPTNFSFEKKEINWFIPATEITNILKDNLIYYSTSKYETKKFITILKDKKIFKAFLLNKSLDEKTYIPNIEIYVNSANGNVADNNLFNPKTMNSFNIYIKFPIAIDGHRFLIEIIDYAKLNAIKQFKSTLDYKSKLLIENLKRENKNLALFFGGNNASKSKFFLETETQLKFKYIENTSKIEEIKKYIEILDPSSFDNEIRNLIEINEFNSENSIITKKSKLNY